MRNFGLQQTQIRKKNELNRSARNFNIYTKFHTHFQLISSYYFGFHSFNLAKRILFTTMGTQNHENKGFTMQYTGCNLWKIRFLMVNGGAMVFTIFMKSWQFDLTVVQWVSDQKRRRSWTFQRFAMEMILIRTAGWWFGTWMDYDFPYIGNFIILTDELIFFRGVYHQPDWQGFTIPCLDFFTPRCLARPCAEPTTSAKCLASISCWRRENWWKLTLETRRNGWSQRDADPSWPKK